MNSPFQIFFFIQILQNKLAAHPNAIVLIVVFLIVKNNFVSIMYFKIQLFPQKFVRLSLMITPWKDSKAWSRHRFERMCALMRFHSCGCLCRSSLKILGYLLIWLDFRVSPRSCGPDISEDLEVMLISMIFLAINICLWDLHTARNIKWRHSKAWAWDLHTVSNIKWRHSKAWALVFLILTDRRLSFFCMFLAHTETY